jgi:hypothetical protein
MRCQRHFDESRVDRVKNWGGHSVSKQPILDTAIEYVLAVPYAIVGNRIGSNAIETVALMMIEPRGYRRPNGATPTAGILAYRQNS